MEELSHTLYKQSPLDVDTGLSLGMDFVVCRSGLSSLNGFYVSVWDSFSCYIIIAV